MRIYVCMYVYTFPFLFWEPVIQASQGTFLGEGRKQRKTVISFVSYIYPKAFIIKCTLFLITSLWHLRQWSNHIEKLSETITSFPGFYIGFVFFLLLTRKLLVQFHLNVNNKNIAKASWANVPTSGENNQRTSYSYVLA